MPVKPDIHPLVLTQGDPEGVGPELLLHVAAAGLLRPGDRVVAQRALLSQLAEKLDHPWAKRGWQLIEPYLVEPPHSGNLGQVAILRHG
ncbi:MAG: hypothetical protein ACPG4T_17320, partial [Nannocystaceae bacterium]